jgi:DNA-directed RNA polymerase specialized sigma24 family protein
MATQEQLTARPYGERFSAEAVSPRPSPDVYVLMDETGSQEGPRARQFSELFAANYGLVLAYARRRVGADLAQDVVADTFLAAWRNMDDLPPEPLPWLYRAAHYAVAGHRKTLARRARRRLSRRLGTSISQLELRPPARGTAITDAVQLLHRILDQPTTSLRRHRDRRPRWQVRGWVTAAAAVTAAAVVGSVFAGRSNSTVQLKADSDPAYRHRLRVRSPALRSL